MSNNSNNNGPKSSGPGSLVQLASYGAEDLILTSDPEFTFFKNTYKRHCNFAIESKQLLFINTPLFGGTSTIIIRKNGDLLSKLYFEVTLPNDPLLTTSYWTNRIGFNLLLKVELYIGKKLIDRLYGIWLHIWAELTHNNDMKKILTKMVGTTDNNGNTNGLNCANSHKLIIPLPFFFHKTNGLALPLNAIRNNQDVTLKFFFETKENCVQTGNLPNGDLLNASVWADYIFLETEENKLYIQNDLEYLIDITQHYERNLITTGTKNIILPFRYPMKELTWVVYNLNTTKDKFTDFTYNDSQNIISMVKDVQFNINSKPILSNGARDSTYFNYIQPYQFHKVYPDLGINCYSSSLYPNDWEPSGEFLFRLGLVLTMNINTYENGYIHIFSSCYNILNFSKGEIKMIYN